MGAATALLLTTKTGKEAREILAECGADFKENLPEGLKEKTDEALDRGREYLDEKKKALNEAIEAGKVAMAKEKGDLTTTPPRAFLIKLIPAPTFTTPAPITVSPDHRVWVQLMFAGGRW